MTDCDARQAFERAYGRAYALLCKKEGHVQWLPPGIKNSGERKDGNNAARKIDIIMRPVVDYIRDNPGVSSKDLRAHFRFSQSDWRYIRHTGAYRYNLIVVPGNRAIGGKFYLPEGM
jgi:hypothetical protein